MPDNNSKDSLFANKLLAKCKGGDTLAFKQLIESNQQFALSLAFKILLNEDLAKDAVQNSFIKVWQNIKRYNPKFKFTTWLYKIVVNCCYDIQKSEKTRISATNQITTNNYTNNTEDSITNKDLIKHIKMLSKDLPKKQRMIFILSDLQSLSITEVSEILNMRKGAVKSNLYYARKCIKENLGGLHNEL